MIPALVTVVVVAVLFGLFFVMERRPGAILFCAETMPGFVYGSDCLQRELRQ